MPEFDLGFLCANPGVACKNVQSLMDERFEMIPTSKNSPYDHIGRITVESLTEIIKIKNNLEKEAKKNISSITIIAR